MKIYCCRNCGISLTNRADWCDLGCGRDYNEMFEVRKIDQFILTYLKQAMEDAWKYKDLSK